MKIIFSPEDLAGQGISAADEIRPLKDRYNEGVSSILLVSPPSGKSVFTAAEACQMRQWYSYVRYQSSDFRSYSSSFDLIEPISLGANRVGVRNILDLDCQQMRWRVDPGEITRKLKEAPWALGHSGDGAMTIAFSFTYVDAEGSRYGSYNPKAVEGLRQNAKDHLQSKLPGARFDWVGAADYQFSILEGFAFSKYVNLMMLVFLVLSLRVIFGTWKSGVIYSVSLLVSAVWIFGAKGLVHSSYDVLSTGLFLILGISSLEDFVFLSGEQMRGKSWRSSVRVMIVPSFFTSLTTILGFLSLCVSQVNSIRDLGVWAAFGAFMEWFVVVVIIPCVLLEFKNLRQWVEPPKGMHFGLVNTMVGQSPKRWLTILSLLVFPLVVFFVGRLNFNEKPHELFPPKQEYSAGISQLMKSVGWMGSVSLLFEPEVSSAEAENWVGKLKQTSIGKELIVRHQSPQNLVDWLLTGRYFDLGDIMAKLQYSEAYEQMVDAEGRIRILLFLKNTAVTAINSLARTTAALCQNGQCHLGGELVAYSQFAGYAPKTLLESLATSLFLVSLVIGFLCLAFGKQKAFVSLVASSFWGPFAMLILLGVTQSNLDFWRSLFASILVGLAGDNGIQFLFSSRKADLSKGISERGSSSIVTSVLMAATALIYLGSYFQPPKAFGVILSTGLLACLTGDLWLLRGYLSLFQKNEFVSSTKR